MPTPGAAMRIKGAGRCAAAAGGIPVNAVQRGREAIKVFVINSDGQIARAGVTAESGAMSGIDIIVYAGLAAGEQVAASGAF